MPNTNPAKMKNPPQSPALSGFQPQNHPLDSTKTPFLLFLRAGKPGGGCHGRGDTFTQFQAGRARVEEALRKLRRRAGGSRVPTTFAEQTDRRVACFLTMM